MSLSPKYLFENFIRKKIFLLLELKFPELKSFVCSNDSCKWKRVSYGGSSASVPALMCMSTANKKKKRTRERTWFSSLKTRIFESMLTVGVKMEEK